MANTNSQKNNRALTYNNTSGKPPPREKPLGLSQRSTSTKWNFTPTKQKTVIILKKDNNPKSLLFMTQPLRQLRKTIVRKKLPPINTFNNQGPTVVNLMRDLTVGIFEHLDITAKTDVDKSVKYIYLILSGPVLKNNHEILLIYKDTGNNQVEDKWLIGYAKDVRIELFGIRPGWQKMMLMGTLSVERSAALTQRRRFGLIRGKAWGGSTNKYFNTT